MRFVWFLGLVLFKMGINKRGDISITILVLAVIFLCTIALLSFYFVGKKEADKIDLVFYLQEVYNSAESFNYSVNILGEESAKRLYGVEKVGDKFVNEAIYAPKAQALIKVKYNIAYPTP